MFSIFSKKRMDETAAKNFWAWFEEKESWIVECIYNHDQSFIWEIDKRLKPVFSYFERELEFQLGYNDVAGELFFFHFDDRKLKKDAAAFGKMMPEDVANRWTFILEK